MLQRSRIVAVVRQLVATRMAQHVRVDGEGQFCLDVGARNELAYRGGGHRLTALVGKHVRALVFAL